MYTGPVFLVLVAAAATILLLVLIKKLHMPCICTATLLSSTPSALVSVCKQVRRLTRLVFAAFSRIA